MDDFAFQFTISAGSDATVPGIIRALRDSDVPTLALCGSNGGGDGVQLGVVTPDRELMLETARRNHWKIGGEFQVLRVQGQGTAGTIGEILERLTEAGIPVTIVQAISGSGRFEAFVRAESDDLRRASEWIDAAEADAAKSVDPVDESSEESFPASDPPSFSPTSLG